jgi:hypothetical protein
MAADPQDTPRHAGQVVRRVLLRRNIAIDAETRSSSPPPSRPRSKPVRPPGGRADARVFPPATASCCSDLTSATGLVWGWVTRSLTISPPHPSRNPVAYI